MGISNFEEKNDPLLFDGVKGGKISVSAWMSSYSKCHEKVWKSHEKVMHKLFPNHIIKSWPNYCRVDMDKSWTSHLQLMNNSWTTHVQVINK